MRKSSDTATDAGAHAEFHSIYEHTEDLPAPWLRASQHPVVRIEDPQGEEVSDEELDGDVSSTDETPRKRNKAGKKRLGFDEQRVALRPRPSMTQRSASFPYEAKPDVPVDTRIYREEEDFSSASAQTQRLWKLLTLRLLRVLSEPTTIHAVRRVALVT